MIRSFLAIFALMLFLFPLAEKEMHALDHHDDEHCAEHELMHLHEKDHVCFICDFTFEKSDAIIWQYSTNVETPTLPHYFLYFSFYQPETKIYFSHRGPPTLV